MNLTQKPAYYAHVDDIWVNKLLGFRRKAQRQQTTIGNHVWAYYDLYLKDDEPEALLLLPGGGGDAETYFRYIEGFAHNFRVIAPDMPTDIDNVDDIILGLRTLLAQLSISKVYLVGIAWGGQIAQIFVRRHPDLIMEAIFAQTTIPNEKDAERIRMQRNIIRLYPARLLASMNKRSLQRAIEQVPMEVPEKERTFWQAYYDEMYSERWKKRDILARARLSIDFHTNHLFDARDALRLTQDILIIEADQDEVVLEGERGSLKAMYPSAYVQTLEGYTHLTPILCADDYLSSMIHFLLKDDYEAYQNL
jgi:pimeloyl-ACP methyl ester carboxylesterase